MGRVVGSSPRPSRGGGLPTASGVAVRGARCLSRSWDFQREPHKGRAWGEQSAKLQGLQPNGRRAPLQRHPLYPHPSSTHGVSPKGAGDLLSPSRCCPGVSLEQELGQGSTARTESKALSLHSAMLGSTSWHYLGVPLSLSTVIPGT